MLRIASTACDADAGYCYRCLTWRGLCLLNTRMISATPVEGTGSWFEGRAPIGPHVLDLLQTPPQEGILLRVCDPLKSMENCGGSYVKG